MDRKKRMYREVREYGRFSDRTSQHIRYKVPIRMAYKGSMQGAAGSNRETGKDFIGNGMRGKQNKNPERSHKSRSCADDRIMPALVIAENHHENPERNIVTGTANRVF